MLASWSGSTRSAEAIASRECETRKQRRHRLKAARQAGQSMAAGSTKDPARPPSWPLIPNQRPPVACVCLCRLIQPGSSAMLISWLQWWMSRLIPGKTLLLVAVSGALGAGLAVGVPALHTWLWGDGSKPAPPPMLDVRFIPLGKTYLPELSRVYATAWKTLYLFSSIGESGNCNRVWSSNFLLDKTLR